jgi:hypothetical protein
MPEMTRFFNNRSRAVTLVTLILAGSTCHAGNVVINKSVIVNSHTSGTNTSIGTISINGRSYQATSDNILIGSGKTVSVRRSLPEFSWLHIRSAANITVKQGQDAHIIISGDDNIVSLFEHRLEQNRLVLSESRSYQARMPLDITVVAPGIEKVQLSGSSNLNMDNMNVPRMELILSGSGSITARGYVGQLAARVLGSGRLYLIDLASRHIDVDIKGSGSAELFSKETLAAAITGSGTILYRGNPQLHTNIRGSGRVIAYDHDKFDQ